MALKDIKAKIGATERTRTVTRALESVSAVKMRKTQGSALAGRSYARAALSVLARLSGTADLKNHPLAKERAEGGVALVIITSDKGLAGSLNSGVIKAAQAALDERKVSTSGPVTIYAYGKKGQEYFMRRTYPVARTWENRRDGVELSVMDELSAELARAFVAGEFREVVVAYSNFKSTFEQSPTVRRLLPLSLPAVMRLVEDILPEKGKFSELKEVEPPASYEVEPSGESVLGALVPRLVAVSLYHMFLESKASEHSARMVAMKSASDKSKEVVRDLTRAYNKARQAAITREVSEIVGGREALAT